MSLTGELTAALLQRKRVEKTDELINACGLLKVAALLTRQCDAKNLLIELLRECNELTQYISQDKFGKKFYTQGVTVLGAYKLLLTLGGEASHKSCLAVGAYMGLSQADALDLLRSILDDNANLDDDTQEDPSQDKLDVAATEKRTPDTSHTRHLEKMEKICKHSRTSSRL